MKKLIFLVLLALLLVSCGEEEIVPQEVVSVDVVEEVEEVAPVTVSPLSTPDFLEPFDKYSWEREYAPEYVMLHFTSAVVLDPHDPYNMESIRKIFEDNEISINYIIDRDGKILCYIPEDRCAWHAGKGSYKDIEKLSDAMNRYSIGIEIVAFGSENDMAPYFTKSDYQALDLSLAGFTEAQYEALVPLIRDICERNGIPYDKEHIIGHEEYKPAKTDPGELFEWDRIFQ